MAVTITITCQVCGSEKVFPLNLHRKFCSKACYDALRKSLARSKYLRGHVQVAERALGHKLPYRACVHHVDLNSRNNVNTNLVICQDYMFHRLLHIRQRVRDAGGNPNTERVCCTCKLVKPKTEFFICRSKKADGLNARCKSCCARQLNLRYHRLTASLKSSTATAG